MVTYVEPNNSDDPSLNNGLNFGKEAEAWVNGKDELRMFNRRAKSLIYKAKSQSDRLTSDSQIRNDVPVLLDSVSEKSFDWAPYYFTFHAPSEHTVNGR